MYNAMYKTCEQNPILTDMFEEKYNQKVLGWISDGNFQLITSFPIRTMEDLKGHKVGHGGPMVPWLSALGATGVQTTLMEAYTSIETGVYDGWAMFLNGVVGYKLFEVAPYYTIVNFGSPVVAVMTVNLNTFNSLPAEVQEIMLKVGNESAARGAEYVKTSETQLMQVLKDGGTNIYTLPVEERARWAKTLDDAGIAAKYVSDANAAGLPGSNVLRSYIHNCETEGYQWPVVPKFD
jgi:TRAP-type C4-dicarboxylate transport system substrate-binding protein